MKLVLFHPRYEKVQKQALLRVDILSPEKVRRLSPSPGVWQCKVVFPRCFQTAPEFSAAGRVDMVRSWSWLALWKTWNHRIVQVGKDLSRSSSSVWVKSNLRTFSILSVKLEGFPRGEEVSAQGQLHVV